MRIVEIRWRDNSTSHGWTNALAKPMEITQVGYLVNETETHYVVADSKVLGDVEDVKEWGCNVAILRENVISFREVSAEQPSLFEDTNG